MECTSCKCARITLIYTGEYSEKMNQLEIMGNYQKAFETVNERPYYISENHDEKYAIWYCQTQWIIGLNSEKGQCQGFAYVNSSSDCFYCNIAFGWRFLLKEEGWELANNGDFNIKCNYQSRLMLLLINV